VRGTKLASNFIVVEGSFDNFKENCFSRPEMTDYFISARFVPLGEMLAGIWRTLMRMKASLLRVLLHYMSSLCLGRWYSSSRGFLKLEW
jgi:hypothetical protein